MRIAHVTDIHWTEDVPLSRLPGKRVLGTANQLLRGRKHHFPEAVQAALVQHLIDLAPDLVVITGDLTAQALPSEFAKAKRFLEPVLSTIPTVILPGNHDLYTQGAKREDRIATYFAQWLHRVGSISRFELDEGKHERIDPVVFLGLDPNRPTWIHASGALPANQLTALATALADPAIADRFILLGLHYPVLDRHGDVYDNTHHGLLNARELIEVLRQAPAKPDLIIFGHVHHGYRTSLDLDGLTVPCIDCGSSGYKYMPEKQRAAAMAVYTVRGKHFTVDRYLHDGHHFEPEPDGAFATGR